MRSLSIILAGAFWFHGARAPFDPSQSSVTYMTDDPTQAAAYARGAHLGGYGEGAPQVTAMQAKPGRVIDINKSITDAIMNDGDIITAIDRSIAAARAAGARYVEYSHPNAGVDGEHTVRVSLYPAEDLIPLRAVKVR